MRKPEYEVVLFEYPEGRDVGAPRLLGTVNDPEIVDAVREVVAANKRALASHSRRPKDGDDPPER